jgi:hypothetical protein
VSEKTNIIFLNDIIKKKAFEKRKETKRVFFQNAISLYAILSSSKMQSVDLIDMSDEGLAFFVPKGSKESAFSGNDLLLRFYFTSHTYFELYCSFRNSKEAIISSVRGMRYGCSVPSDQASYSAYKAFVSFIKAYSSIAKAERQVKTL